MKKNELKRMLKPLIKECIKEVILEEGVLSNVISEVFKGIEKIIEKPIFGLFHCGSRDKISKYDFGKKMAEIFQLSDSNINRVSVDSVHFKASEGFSHVCFLYGSNHRNHG